VPPLVTRPALVKFTKLAAFDDAIVASSRIVAAPVASDESEKNCVANIRSNAGPEDVMPVRVRAHAFGPGQPAVNLRLSPDHAICYRNVLVPVRYLENGSSIARDEIDEVVYWHVELDEHDEHDVLFADGLACESHPDVGRRAMFVAEGSRHWTPPPAFGRFQREAAPCLPLVARGPEVADARRLLADTAAGWQGDAVPRIGAVAHNRRAS
jgi:hypothetical protein